MVVALSNSLYDIGPQCGCDDCWSFTLCRDEDGSRSVADFFCFVLGDCILVMRVNTMMREVLSSFDAINSEIVVIQSQIVSVI